MATYAKYKSLGKSSEPSPNQYTNIPQISSAEHKLELIQTNQIVVVLISADWCGPCKMIKPKYGDMVAQHTIPGACVLVIEDVDKKISDVNGVPAIQIFFRGKMVENTVGPNLDEVNQQILRYKSGL